MYLFHTSAYNDRRTEFVRLTLQTNFAIFSSVIVLWKLAKPAGGGELSSLSLFYITGDFSWQF